MNKYPLDLQELEQELGTAKQCFDYLYPLRWPDGYRCPQCQHSEAWKIGDHKYKCKNKNPMCRHQTTVITETMFSRTHLQLPLWFRAIWLATTQKGGTSALWLQKELEIGSYRTAWTVLQKIRKAMSFSDQSKLQGTILVDHFSIMVNDDGFPDEKHPVLIAVEVNEKKIGRIRMSKIDCEATEAPFKIARFIQRCVEPSNCILRTDDNDNIKLDQLPEDIYPRRNRNKKEGNENYKAVRKVITYLEESRLLGSPPCICMGEEHFDLYLNECCFKFNRRHYKCRGKMFYDLLKIAVSDVYWEKERSSR